MPGVPCPQYSSEEWGEASKLQLLPLRRCWSDRYAKATAYKTVYYFKMMCRAVLAAS